MTRKEEIELYIKNETTKKINDDSFNFENCNAFIISLDLNINRSNVSRILNQLFIENRLIKIEGRPTLYISKAAIIDNLQISNLPSVIKKDENIKKFLKSNSPAPITKNKIDIIGIQKNESLYNNFNKLMAYILTTSRQQPLYLFLSGEIGTGRKYMIEKIFEFAKRKKIYSSEQTIFYGSDYSYFDYLLDKINPEYHPILLIDVTNDMNNTISYATRISELYKNRQIIPPIVGFIINFPPPKKWKNSYEFFSFPKLTNRTNIEYSELILYFFLLQSNTINRELILSKEIFLIFALHKYDNNCIDLYHNIYTFVCLNLIYSNKSKNTPILLDKCFLPDIFKNSIEDSSVLQKENFKMLSNNFTIKPKMSLDDIKQLIVKNSETIFLPLPNSINNTIEYLISDFTTSMSDYSTKHDSSFNLIYEKISNTILGKDPQLLNLIINIISEFKNNRISLMKYKIQKILPISKLTDSIYKSIMYSIRNIFLDVPVMDSESHIIKQLIEHSIVSVQKSKIPILIICHENNLAQNYANRCNITTSSRRYYSIDYSRNWQEKGIKSFTTELYNIINVLNRGKGVILLVDSYPLTIIDSNLVLNLKFPIFSFSPVSISILQSINSTMAEQAISIVTAITKNQNYTKEFLNSNSFTIKSNRLKSTSFSHMKDLFPYLDTTKTNEALFTCLIQICEELNISLTNQIIIDFIFHGTFILNRIHTKNRSYPEPEFTDENIFDLIQKKLRSQPIFSDIKFDTQELSILYNSLFTNILDENLSN